MTYPLLKLVHRDFKAIYRGILLFHEAHWPRRLMAAAKSEVYKLNVPFYLT
jgi:hypothetical protein